MGNELNDAIYQANHQMEAWATDCNKTLSCSTIEQYIEVELSIVTQRYDRFGRLVSETIENLRIRLRDTREREVSRELTCGVYRHDVENKQKCVIFHLVHKKNFGVLFCFKITFFA